MSGIRKLPYKSYLALNRSLKFLETAQVKDYKLPLSNPPVFILGAPRCGSTLLYQSLVASLNFSYFSNRHCFWFGMPWFIEKITESGSDYRKNPDFNSRLGTTDGELSPAECGEFWYRFYSREPQYWKAEGLSSQKTKELRTALHAFSLHSSSPLLIKNLVNVLRLESLVKVVPEAKFIIVHRNPLDIAHSILSARMKQSGSYSSWFSLKPEGWQSWLDLGPEVQVVNQIKAVYDQINSVEESTNQFDAFHLNYEDFCKSPNEMTSRIQSFLADKNINIEKVADLPDSFPIRTKVTIDESLYKSLKSYLSEHPISK
jgi:hypothetical protein